MTSTATNDGVGVIEVYFKVGTDPDLASVKVQNRVSRATPLLPVEVTRAGVTVVKRQRGNLLIASLYSDERAYDETFLQNYALINIVPRIKRVTGVGKVTVFGVKDYAMRIWLKPDAMAAYRLMPSDIVAALDEQNLEAAPGKVGENSDQSFMYMMKYPGRLKSAEEFEQIIVKSGDPKQILRLKDVARIELGALSYSSDSATNGKPSVAFSVSQTAGSNAREIINESKAILEEASLSFPRGVHHINLFDADDLLSASIAKVVQTLVEAFLLVFLVVFVFLQDFRSTLIPAIAVPVAIIGTFAFLKLFGFTINLLTLFALVLAIGIVVDDAIVVVEAVHAKLHAGETSARRAALSAMSDIAGAIVSITLVMAAVFVPVTFLSGSVGVFYRQFGLTLAVSILLSAVNALTLSPALCALLLRPHAHGEAKRGRPKRALTWFYDRFNRAFEATTRAYMSIVSVLARHAWLGLLIVAVFTAGLVELMRTTSSSFVPDEDQGTIFANITLPPATTTERTGEVAEEIDRIAHEIPEVESTLRIVGENVIAGVGSPYAMIVIRLVHWNDRKGVDTAVVIRRLREKTSAVRSAEIVLLSPPTVPGFSTTGGFTFDLQDQGGHTFEQFFKVSDDFLAALNERAEIRYAQTPFKPTFPQLRLEVNVAKCEEAGISPRTVLTTMQGYFGGLYASNINLFGKLYRVMVQSDHGYRASPASLGGVFVRVASGEMAPITSFVKLDRISGPDAVTRFNLFSSIPINGAPGDGYSSGDAIRAIRETALEKLPPGYGYEFSGITREEISAGTQSTYVFLLCVVFVYLLLCAQYESYLLPFAVLLSLPLGLVGTFLLARLRGIDNNVYVQIALVMLIGLLAKNAILIVEYSVSLRRKGTALLESATLGAKARFRPILMTSFAFILGLVPLMLSSGAGAAGNRAIGTAAVGGMLLGTLIGPLVIPALYVTFQTLQEKISGAPSPAMEGEETPTAPDAEELA
jgi:hydrophobic/amphiphilic exporter-1 (mainly G- bacteria), HAE1 family